MSFRVEGLRDLEKALMQLKDYSARRVGKRAMTKALEPVAHTARALAPRSNDGKNMADSIAVGGKLTPAQAKEVRSVQREARHIMLMYVGPREPHAHLVEFGTVERFHRSGKSVGAMPPSPFMRPAWDQNTNTVLDILVQELRVELDKAIARAAKRGTLGDGSGGDGWGLSASGGSRKRRSSRAGYIPRPYGKSGWRP